MYPLQKKPKTNLNLKKTGEQWGTVGDMLSHADKSTPYGCFLFPPPTPLT